MWPYFAEKKTVIYLHNAYSNSILLGWPHGSFSKDLITNIYCLRLTWLFQCVCRVLLVHTWQLQLQVHPGQSEPHATLDYAGVKEVPTAKERGEMISICVVGSMSAIQCSRYRNTGKVLTIYQWREWGKTSSCWESNPGHLAWAASALLLS